MVCPTKEDHGEMNLSNTGSRAAFSEARGLEWNQILALKETASGSWPAVRLGHLTSQRPQGLCSAVSSHHIKHNFPRGK